ncbi:MAG: hypothetical protein JRN52_11605 [Nitrososphaerota archaeon]|nr:hypothetical protein [Nitrososphaerota archaeon]
MSLRSKYYPKHFSLSTPTGKDMHEFLIIGERESTPDIVAVFSKFNIDIVRMEIDEEPVSNKFLFGGFCSVARSNVTVDVFSAELKKLRHVERVEFLKADNALFSRFFFPLYVTNESRGIVMRMDPLLKIEQHLLQILGSAGAAIMFDEGKTYAVETVQLIKKSLPDADTSVLLRNIVEALRATGWGLFAFKENEEGFYVTVEHPPRLKSGGMAENKFVAGVTVGILVSLYGKDLSVASSQYHETDDLLVYKLQRTTRTN